MALLFYMQATYNQQRSKRKMSEDKKALQVRIPADLHDWVGKKAGKTFRSVNQFILDLLIKEKKKDESN
jgi:predicted HicB family RNase H-like nuclease